MTELLNDSTSKVTNLAYYITIYGDVQGVGFRAKLQETAIAAGITGWVKNSKYGHVEIFIEGKKEKVRQLKADLQLGKLKADIENCVISAATHVGHRSFTILATAKKNYIKDFYLPSILERSRFISQEYKNINNLMLELTSAKGDKVSQVEFQNIAKEVPARFLGEPLVQRRSRMDFTIATATLSFAAETWSHIFFSSEFVKQGTKTPESLLDNKSNGKIFAKKLGYKVPQVYQHDVTIDEIELRAGIVVKPVKGSSSKGVYSLLSNTEIYNLGEGKPLSSIDDFLSDIRDTEARIGGKNRWSVEEMVLNDDGLPPNDLKMLTFYGRVVIVQEETRMPTRFCYYDRNGVRIRTGRYEDKEFGGTGLLPEYIAAAEDISAKIPAPFCRIDFLKSRNGPVFGEFTPKPGNFHRFSTETDTWLGQEFVAARARLTSDLLNGKKFHEFRDFASVVNNKGST